MSRKTRRRGLVLVVGPSGAGKDTLIDGARAALSSDDRFVFPTREVTRPAPTDSESHVAVTEAEFDARHAAGVYALAWQAHGLRYGVPAKIADELEAGRTVIVNVSRTIVGDARRRFNPVHVVRINASDERRRQRLISRRREEAAAIEQRLSRAAIYADCGPNEIAIENDGDAEDGIAALTDFLRSLQAADA